MWRCALLAIAMWAGAEGAALACRDPGDESGIIHEALPAARLPPDAIVLDVAVDQTTARPGPIGDLITVTARVRNVIRGTYDHPTIDVVVNHSSCSRPFLFGTEGMIIVTRFAFRPEEPASYVARERRRDEKPSRKFRGQLFRATR